MFLGKSKQAHDDQSRQDTSGYEVLHSARAPAVATVYSQIMNTMGAAVNAPKVSPYTSGA